MDEQTGSPGANAENNNQRNGDEVRVKSMKVKSQIFHSTASVYYGGLLPEPSKHVFAEAPTWQLDQGEEEEEADEGQQCTQSPAHRLCSLHERQAGAAPGRASRRALSRDNKDVGQRVEQTAP